MSLQMNINDLKYSLERIGIVETYHLNNSPFLLKLKLISKLKREADMPH